MKKFNFNLWASLIFIVLYGLFVFFFDYTFDHYAEILASTVFFFALFAGFFISRQNERLCNVYSVIAEEDAIFCYLYRMANFFPKIQDRVREIAIEHYLKIKKSGNWAYHTDNPSTSITDLTDTFGEIDSPENIERAEKPAMSAGAEIIWDGIKDLQHMRKKILCLKNQKLLYFQWLIVYILAAILIISFNFIPSPKEIYVDVLKIFFGTSVFLVVFLLRQLDSLSLFGKDFAQKIADDVLWIVEEKDKEATGILDEGLKEKIKRVKQGIREKIRNSST